MKKFFYIPVVCILFLFSLPLSAQVWESQASGYWTDTTVWGTSNAPTYTTSDTFIIKHYIIFQQTLTLNGPSNVKIEAQGTLCGLTDFKLYEGAVVEQYGNIYCRDLIVNGSLINVYGPGSWKFCGYLQVTNGGLIHQTGGTGGTMGHACFCQFPELPPVSITETTVSRISVYPNPGNGIIYFESEGEIPDRFIIYDITGRKISENVLTSSPARLECPRLPSGVFFILFYRDGVMIQREKVVVN